MMREDCEREVSHLLTQTIMQLGNSDIFSLLLGHFETSQDLQFISKQSSLLFNLKSKV